MTKYRGQVLHQGSQCQRFSLLASPLLHSVRAPRTLRATEATILLLRQLTVILAIVALYNQRRTITAVASQARTSTERWQRNEEKRVIAVRIRSYAKVAHSVERTAECVGENAHSIVVDGRAAARRHNSVFRWITFL